MTEAHTRAPRPTWRLIPSRFPPVGLFDTVATAADLEAVMELAGWTNDRLVPERIARLPKAKVGAVYGSADMVLHTLDKAKMRAQGGAMLVDMESHVAAKLAAAAGLPLAVVRVVSDKAGVSLPPAVLEGMTEDGGMNLIGVLSALVRHPAQLPALIRTGQDADRAFKVLAAVAERALKP